MKWCIFVNRMCHGEDCVGWIKDKCFVYALLPVIFSNEEHQTEFNWSEYESHQKTEHDPLEHGNDQMTLFREIEEQIVQRASG